MTRETIIDGFDVNYILVSIGYLMDSDYKEIEDRFSSNEEIHDYLFSKMNIQDYKNFVRRLMSKIDDAIDNGIENLEDVEGEFCNDYGLEMLKKYSNLQIKEEYFYN